MRKTLISSLVALMATHSLYANYQIIDSTFKTKTESLNDSNPQTVAKSEGTAHFVTIDQLKPYTVTSILVEFEKGGLAREYSVSFGEDAKQFGLVSKTALINNQALKIDFGNKGIGGRYIQLKFKSQKTISIKEIRLNLLKAKTYGYSSVQGLKQARSVHLGFSQPPADAIYIEAKPTAAPNGTYFCQLGFHGGYFGIQQLGNGKKVSIFSIWDGSSHNPESTVKELRANAIFAKDGVNVQRFGGEGSGIKSMMAYDWKLNQYSAYMVTVRPTAQPNRNIYTAFLQNPETKKWFRMASFNAIGKSKLRGFHTFVEDFKRNYTSYNLEHKSSYRNPWYYQKSENKWYPVETLFFTADSAVSVNINAKVNGSEASLETGGKVVNQQKVFSGAKNKVISKTAPKIDFEMFPTK